MKKNATYNTVKSAIGTLLIVSAATGMVSCTDESFDSRTSQERIVRFDVKEANEWSTRSGDSPQCGVVTLSSDEQPLYLVPSVLDGISLGTSAKTRGTQITTETMESFGVFASIAGSGSGPDYMYNEQITSDRDWTPAKEYLWPGEGALHINAYSPFVEASGSEGVTFLPSSSDTELMIGYAVPAKVSDQPDLMWSTPKDASASPCELTFNHALTAIRFSAGAELAPCTVKEITISGVKDSGNLNLETGEWSDVEGSASYTVAPELVLTAADGSSYVEPGTPIVDGDNTFLLMPQTLDASSKISLTVEFNGKDVVLDASLEGQVWEAGKTVVYRISANPASEYLIFDVTGNFATNYTGGTDPYTVKSSYVNGENTQPVKWIAEFVDDNGNVIDQPAWVTSFVTSGEGDAECNAVTAMHDIIFNEISEQSRILQNAADINQTSGNTPYNLASASGGSAVENTANTYIINAPGKYSLPLVYGNAVKNGATNAKAYTTTSHNSKALKTFVNHLGNGVTDPYIYNNSGCTPADAVLLWEDALNMIRDVKLSADGKSIEFDIPHNTIRQGNALIGVRDKDGNIMWSWQLWVTDYQGGTDTQNITYSGKAYHLYPRSIGEVKAGDVVTFTPCSVKVRFTQTDVPAGLEPLQRTVELTQVGKTISTPDCFTYYQWGRKDPMMSDIKQWYDSDHQEKTSLTLKSLLDLTDDESVEAVRTLHPEIFWKSPHDNTSDYVMKHINLWNANMSETAYVKTIYDPSPVGAIVAGAAVLRQATDNATIRYVAPAGPYRCGLYYLSFSDGTEVCFPAMGYRSSSSGQQTNEERLPEYWTFDALTTGKEARALVITSDPSASVLQEPINHAFGVRPMLE